MKYIYFSAPWCGPCRLLGPTMEKVSEQVPVEKYNADENLEMTQKFNVRSIPSVILVDSNEKELERILGNNNTELYLNKFKEYEK